MAFRELHSGNFGKAAAAFHNKVMVAKHYTEEARMEDPSASVLEGVTDAAESVTAAINLIDNPPQPPAEPETGQRFVLTPTIDDFEGTDFDDTIVAAPVQGTNNNFSETLNAFDSIDGGGGTDTIRVSGDGDLDIDLAQVSNVEIANIRTPGSINADMSDWAGLESVEIDRFGSASDVTVIVDGATVSVNGRLTIGGDATIVGADGAVNINAGDESEVHVGSAGHTESVMVKGGKSVLVDNGAGKQSETVTAVVVDGVARDPAPETGGEPADTSAVREAQVPAPTGLTYVVLNEDGDEYDPVTARDLALGPYYLMDQEKDLAKNEDGDDVALESTEILVTSNIEDAKDYVPKVDGESNAMPTVTVNSNAIEMVHLHRTNALVEVKNASKNAEDKAVLEDLTVMVDQYGKFGTGSPAGELEVSGAGGITIKVAGKSEFALASDKVETLTISADANLTLDVNKVDGMPSSSLKSLTISGEGNVEIADATMSKLAEVDASGASGDVILGKGADMGFGKTVTSYKGGSGFDCITVTTFAAKGITVDLGAGNDAFKASGGNKDSRIDGGDGTDTLMLRSTAGATYQDAEKKTKSIYSGFEILDAGGGSGAYDIAMLGVNEVQVTSDADVTFNKMADGMDISVHGEKAADAEMQGGTSATIVQDLVAREPGQPRQSGQLDVHLVANGNADTKAATTGEVRLTLTVADEVDTLIVDSTANVSVARTATPATTPTAADYENSITLSVDDGVAGNTDSATVEEIFVTGTSGLVIAAADGATATASLAQLELLDASRSSGGIVFNGGVDVTDPDDTDVVLVAGHNLANTDLELYGSSAADTIHGGSAGNEITGGGGADALRGGDGTDLFMYNHASESTLSFGGAARSTPQGMDSISNFTSGTDDIVLSKAIWAQIKGKPITEYQIGTADDAEGDTLKAVVESQGKAAAGGGFFVTVDAADNTGNLLGGGSESTTNGIVSVTDTENNARWVFIDANGDGKFSGDDLVIRLVGDGSVPSIVLGDFMEAS